MMKRRELLELGLALGGTAMLHRRAFAAAAASPAVGANVAADAKLAAGEFPPNFHWGAATSA